MGRAVLDSSHVPLIWPAATADRRGGDQAHVDEGKWSNRLVSLPVSKRELRYGCLWPHGHPFREYQQAVADRVEHETQGKITVTLSEPLPERELVDRLRLGEIEMASTSALQEDVPEMGLSYLPYTYTDMDHFARVWDIENSPVATKISQIVLSRTNLRVMGWSIVGWRDLLTKNGSVKNLEDVRELTIRVDAPTTRSTFEAFGAETVEVPYLEVRNGFSQGRINAAENSVLNMLFLRWHMHARWLSETAHTLLANLEVVRGDIWDAMHQVERNALEASFRTLIDESYEGESRRRRNALLSLRDAGVNVVPASAIALEEFARRTQSVRRAFVQEHRLDSEWKYILSTKQ